MNIKSAVLTSAFVMLACASNAADITSPFYVPSKGKMLSETSMEYKRINLEKPRAGNAYNNWYGKQTLSYGVAKNMSIFAAIGNTFDTRGYEVEYNNSHNFDYTLGLKSNYYFGNFIAQLSAAYNTFQPNSFYSAASSTAWNKYADLGIKIGYDNPCVLKGVIPYIAFNAIYGLNTVDQLNVEGLEPMVSPYEDKFTYVTYAGVYNDFGSFSTDVGVKWQNVRRQNAHNNEDNLRRSRDDVYAQAAVNYKLSKTMSVGIYGDYLVGSSNMPEFDYDYTLGANLKVAF